MRNRSGRFLSILFIATVLAASLTVIHTVHSSSSNGLTIIPQSIVDPSIDPGSTIVINVSVVDVIDLYTWQVTIFFNPTVLNCTKAFYPSDHIFAGRNFMPVSPVIKNAQGSVMHGASLMGDELGFNGDGTLCQIQFKVLSRGFSGLNFSKPYGSDTFLLNSYLQKISATVTDGYFDNRLAIPQPPVASFDYSPKPPLVNQITTFDASASYDPDGTIVSYQWSFGDGGTSSGKIVTYQYTSAGTFTANLTVTDNDGLTDAETKQITVYEALPAKLYVDPPEIIDPTLLPPAIVTINVTVDDVIGMYDYVFKLSYNTEMLTCIGAIVNRVQGQTDFTPIILINDEVGYIQVNVTYHPPATPITTNTPEALVTIFFQIDTLGSSILHLYDTELSGSSGQLISHETSDGFILTLIRDVAVTYVAPSANWTYQGWTVDISVKANNYGNISESFDVKVYYDSSLIGTLPVVNLAPNAETLLSFQWDTTGVPEGTYTLTGEATTVPFEYNTTNNIFVDGTVQVFTKIRDVAIESVVASRSWVFPGTPVNITVTAKNMGETTESFDVKAYYDSNLLGTYPVVNLPPATEIIVVFTWNTSGLTPCHNFTITGEATTIPFEYNTTNNIFVDGGVKIRIVGDVNGDGRVDMEDIGIIGAAFGTEPGDPRWNPEADITGDIYLVPDGRVNMLDLAVAARNFGQTCGP